MIIGRWYYCMNRGAWRGPMQYCESGFWFPEWVGEFKEINFGLDHIDYGIEPLLIPSPEELKCKS